MSNIDDLELFLGSDDCGIDFDDIDQVYASYIGECDCFNWHWVGKLKGGQYFFLTGRCYTVNGVRLQKMIDISVFCGLTEVIRRMTCASSVMARSSMLFQLLNTSNLEWREV